MTPVTFIYTNSLDLTTDLLISKIGPEKIFRFNFDLWREYKIKIDPRQFTIENPTGRRLESKDIAKFYWRRPHSTQRLYPDRVIPQEVLYMEEELAYALRDMVSLAWSEGKIVLAEPMADSRVGKFVQLKVAAKYFNVPAYKFVVGSPESFEENKISIVKSLTSKRIKDSAVLYTTRVEEKQLDSSTPWFVQDYVQADRDITVVFVCGTLYAFELNREGFLERTVDWREMGPDTATDAWLPHRLPKPLEKAIVKFMKDLDLVFGRLDLLISGGEYYFLEVNPNGEWAWLDFDGKAGLLKKMIKEISPETPGHCIPVPRAIRL